MKQIIKDNPFVSVWLALLVLCVVVASFRQPALPMPGPPWDEDGQAAQWEDLQDLGDTLGD